MAPILVGMAGWSFDGWRATFYPEGLKQKDELAHASRRVYSIEVNGTFYNLFKPDSFQSWYALTPPDFKFSMKGPKYITHERRLKDFQMPLNNFLASGILALGEKLGVLLWQFPPTLPFLIERFEPFMAALPHDMQTAAEMGKNHSEWMQGRTYLEVKENHRIRHAIEGRHESFKDPRFVELARKHGIAIVVGDTAGRWPLIEDVTTDFLYLRLHGDEIKYPDGYTKEALEYWGERFKCWTHGDQPKDAALVVPETPKVETRTIFAYFDNDVKETAPLNALSMITYLTQAGEITERVFTDMPEIGARKAAKREKEVKAATKEKAVSKKKAVKKAAKKPATRVKKAAETRQAKKKSKKSSA